jgi:hypothetical protein
MGGRRYRVVKTLPWSEGGQPAPPPLYLEGAKYVIYQPGDPVYMEDVDLPWTHSYLKAIDGPGRAALKQVRAALKEDIGKSAELAQEIATADIPHVTEFLAHALRREGRQQAKKIGADYAILRDGTKQLISTTDEELARVRVYPVDPLPGVIYDDYGTPKSYETALQWEQKEKESKLARIHRGASRGGRRGREAKRDKTARADEALLSAVRAYRRAHSSHGRPTIAAALLKKHGRKIDLAAGPKKAIAALVKRIERLEKKSLDT